MNIKTFHGEAIYESLFAKGIIKYGNNAGAAKKSPAETAGLICFVRENLLKHQQLLNQIQRISVCFSIVRINSADPYGSRCSL
jgi:hypothetical protein